VSERPFSFFAPSGEDLGGERVEQGVLDQALERAGAEGGVVAAFGEQVAGAG
jgi:hypothetical protein